MHRYRRHGRRRRDRSAPPGRTPTLQRRRPSHRADRVAHDSPPGLIRLWPWSIAESWALSRDREGVFGQ